MQREIVVHVQKVKPGSKVSQILHDGQGTKCNSYLYDCGSFQYETHIIKKGPDQKIIPEQVQIGLCLLTGVACWRIAEIIAIGLPSVGTQPNQSNIVK